ncbi:MAG: hypothetical protein IKO61_00640 [Lachnospiraceae bacterium]|nr:hypothetical protein [Lachnospiraceae bacterium]
MMNRRNGPKVYIIVPVLVVIVIFVYYIFGFKIMSTIHADKSAHDIAELTRLAIAQIDAGKESATFYVSGITEEQIRNINDYIVSINGMVDQYTVMEKMNGGMRIMLKFEISDNYYVLDKYLHDRDIPEDRLEAKKLYDKTTEVLKLVVRTSMTDYEKELAIHDYIVSHCEYGYVDTAKKYAYRAYGALVNEKAVCNGYAEAMALLLSCAGVENRIINGYADDEPHAWNLVYIEGRWYQVDSTWDDPLPDRGAFAGHMYFNVTDEIMDERHDWDKNEYVECKDTVDNYYEKGHLVVTHPSFEGVVQMGLTRNIKAPVEVVVTDYSESLYDLQFIYEINGVNKVSFTNEPYGKNNLITIYVNQ